MKSKYSIRLYEILRSYKNLGKYVTQLDYLREILNADNYKLTGDLFRWCVDPAVREINEVSDLQVHMTKIYSRGSSRRITGVEFLIKEEMYPEIQLQFRADLIGAEI